jgi:hypothetical protein
MADREPVTLEDVLTPEQLEEFKQAIEDDNAEVFRTFFESKEFPLLPEDEFQEIPLTFYVLGAHHENGYRIYSSYRPNIFKYLLDHGANLDFLSGNTVASQLSETFFPGDDFIIDVWTTLAANAAVLGNVPALKLLYERGADFSILPEKEVEDGWESIPGETIQYFVEKKLDKLNDDIKLHMDMIPAYERWQAQGIAVHGGLNLVAQAKQRLNELLKQRIELARVLRWIRYITTEENIPAYRTTAKNRKAYANVLLRAPGLGRLEKNYLMSFVPKPAKFAVYPEHGLKRVNTSLFQGGKTRRRRARKMRSRRNKRRN